MKNLSEISEKLARLLLEQKKSLAVAESCTGGWLAKCLTDIAGSSAWFERGFVTYSNAAKQELLQVSAGTLGEFGAVSEAVVQEMATGVLANSHADIAVAISGIAGPGGGSAEKPVGTVCFAWHVRYGQELLMTNHFSGGREAVRRAAVYHAMFELVALLEND